MTQGTQNEEGKEGRAERMVAAKAGTSLPCLLCLPYPLVPTYDHPRVGAPTAHSTLHSLAPVPPTTIVTLPKAIIVKSTIFLQLLEVGGHGVGIWRSSEERCNFRASMGANLKIEVESKAALVCRCTVMSKRRAEIQKVTTALSVYLLTFHSSHLHGLHCCTHIS